jgi:aminopeptidase
MSNQTQDFEAMQAAYADLLVRTGLNVQPGQSVRILAELGHRTFAQQVVRAAYTAGAGYVHVEWMDPVTDYIRLNQAPEERLGYVPAYKIARHQQMLDEHWAMLSLVGTEFPNLFDGVDPARMQKDRMGTSQQMRFWSSRVSNSDVAWCVAAVPNRAWAVKVLPDLPPDEALSTLWETVFQVCRLYEPDPIQAWAAHGQRLKQAIAFMAQKQVRGVRFLDPTPGPDGKPSTDLTVGLTDRPAWVGASSVTPQGVEFVPNIPTEEIFSSPHRERVDGWVRISKPAFPLQREVIGMVVRFAHGQVVDFSADQGEEILASFFDIPGARRLGEVALVDVRSPINRSGIIFYNILFDENAVCHIAFGRAYSAGVEGGEQMEEDALHALGINDSSIHLDVMIGTETMQVWGLCADGQDVLLMQDGRFVQAVAG